MKLYWKYILVSLVIGLFLGAAASALSMRMFSLRWMRSGPDVLLKRFSHELNLTLVQQEQIKTILYANREKMKACRQEIRSAARTDIRKLLSPGQQQRFDVLEAQREARWKKWRGKE